MTPRSKLDLPLEHPGRARDAREPHAAGQGQALDVEGWPRVAASAVVVEFYATWCKPCMRAQVEAPARALPQ